MVLCFVDEMKPSGWIKAKDVEHNCLYKTMKGSVYLVNFNFLIGLCVPNFDKAERVVDRAYWDTHNFPALLKLPSGASVTITQE